MKAFDKGSSAQSAFLEKLKDDSSSGGAEEAVFWPASWLAASVILPAL